MAKTKFDVSLWSDYLFRAYGSVLLTDDYNVYIVADVYKAALHMVRTRHLLNQLVDRHTVRSPGIPLGVAHIVSPRPIFPAI